MINEETRSAIKAFLGGFIQGLVEHHYHSFALRYLDMHHQVLLGADFWTLIGGEGTYEELLEIYQEVGREKGKAMIDALAFGF